MRGAVGRGIAAHKGECDRAVDVGEDRRGTGPAAVQQGAQLVGEREALGHQIIPAADQGAQRLDVIRAGRQPPKAVAVGAQDISQHEVVGGIALAAGGSIARPAGLHHVGVDRHDRVFRRNQAVDEEAGRPLDGNRHFACPGHRLRRPISSAMPSASCRTSKRSMIRPASSMMQTARPAPPQSTPA